MNEEEAEDRQIPSNILFTRKTFFTHEKLNFSSTRHTHGVFRLRECVFSCTKMMEYVLCKDEVTLG